MKIAFNAFIEKEPDSSLSQRGKVSTQVPAVLLRLYQPLVAVPLHINLVKVIIYHGHINWFALKPDCISDFHSFIPSRSEIRLSFSKSS